MRIAFVSAAVREGQDGVSRCVRRMVDEALVRGHEAAVVTSDGEETGLFAPLHTVPSFRLPMHRAYRMAYPGSHSVSRCLEGIAPDVVHVNSPCTLGYAAIRWAGRKGVPVVATYHTHFPSYARYYKVRALEDFAWRLVRFFYGMVDRTFVPTRPIMAELEAHGISRLEYLPNGFDPERFHPSYRSESWRGNLGAGSDPIVLFVSRLVWEKDLRILAEAYSILRARGVRFRMALAGDGHARSELEKMMPGACFLGAMHGRELSEVFASADVFAFPSTTETFGLVTLEAMASGLAVVAAKIGGAVELIEEGVTGLFAEPLDPVDLAGKIELLINDASLRNALATRAFGASQRYSWEKVLDRLFAAYEEVSERRGAVQIAA